MFGWLFSSCAWGEGELDSEVMKATVAGEEQEKQKLRTQQLASLDPEEPRLSLGPGYSTNPESFQNIAQASLTADDGSVNMAHLTAELYRTSRKFSVAALETAREIQRPQMKYRLAELFVIIVLGVVVYVWNRELAKVIEGLRDSAKDINIVIIIFSFLVLSVIRASFPPWYFCFPLDATTQIILGDRFNIYISAVVWQAMGFFLYSVQFIFLRYFYTDFMRVLCDVDANINEGCYRYFYDVRQGLKLFDKHYQHLLNDIYSQPLSQPNNWQNWGWNGLIVVLLFNCEYWSNYLCIIWLATRAGNFIRVSQYVFFLFISLILEYPKAIIWIRIYVGVVDSIELSNFTKIFSEIDMYEVIGYVIIAGVSTLYIHGQHVYMMLSFFRSMTTSSGDQAIELSESNSSDVQGPVICESSQTAVQEGLVRRYASFGGVGCEQHLGKETASSQHDESKRGSCESNF